MLHGCFTHSIQAFLSDFFWDSSDILGFFGHSSRILLGFFWDSSGILLGFFWDSWILWTFF